jgi:hypothetical protein
VFTLNVATVIIFATLKDALQLLLQRLTQLLTIVMISHMFLNLKGSNLHGPNGGENRTQRLEHYGTDIPLVTGSKQMSSLIRNLGNDIVHTSKSDPCGIDKKVGKNHPCISSLTLYYIVLYLRTSTTITLPSRERRSPIFYLQSEEFGRFRCATARTYNKNNAGGSTANYIRILKPRYYSVLMVFDD